jgi:hypothetical protein
VRPVSSFLFVRNNAITIPGLHLGILVVRNGAAAAAAAAMSSSVNSNNAGASPQPNPPQSTEMTATVSEASEARHSDAVGASPSKNDATISSGPAANQLKALPPIPPPGEQGSGDAITLDISSGRSTVKLDHLGPLVINQDGTASRIANWAEMAEIERQNTLRVLGKRNQLRIAKLKEEMGLDEKE